MFQPGSSSDPWALEEQAEAKRKREKHEAKEFRKYHNMVSCYKMTCKLDGCPGTVNFNHNLNFLSDLGVNIQCTIH